MTHIPKNTLILVLLVAISMHVIAGHPFSAHSTVAFETIAKDRCYFLKRFGTQTGTLELTFQYRSAFRDDKVKPESNFNLELLVLDHQGSQVFTNGKASNDSLLMDRLVGISRRRYDIEVLKDNTDHWSDIRAELDNHHSHLYFYICDTRNQSEVYVATRNKHLLHDMLEMVKYTGPVGSASLIAAKALTGIGVAEIEYTIQLHGYTKTGYKTHLTIEDQWTMHICVIYILLYAGLLAVVGQKVYAYYIHNESVDYPLVLVLGSISLQTAGLIIKVIQTLVHGYYGYPLTVITLFSLLWHMGSDIMISLLFVMMAQGWGVLSKDILFYSDYEFAIGFFILIGRYVWTAISFFLDFGTQDHYHIYDGMLGWFELFNTIIFFIWFSYSVKHSELYKQAKFTGLCRQLTAFAAIHYLIKPILIAIVNKFDRQHRHPIALIFSLGTHWLVCLLTGITFTQKKGQYMRMSVSNGIELAGITKL